MTGNGTSTSTVLTATVPAADLGFSATSAATIKLFGIEVSETGYSSNEATAALISTGFGYGTNQAVNTVNSFTSTAATGVPEPGTWASLGAGVVARVLVQRFRRRSVA